MSDSGALPLRTWLLLAALVFGCPSVAQEAAEPAEEPDGTEEAASDAPSPEVFIPTEEISEDFAVSFPVDI